MNRFDVYIVYVDRGHVPRTKKLSEAALKFEAANFQQVVGRFKYSDDLRPEDIAAAIDHVDDYVPRWARPAPSPRA